MPSPEDLIRQELDDGKRVTALSLALRLMAGDETGLCQAVWHEFVRDRHLLLSACEDAVQQEAAVMLHEWIQTLKNDSALRAALTQSIGLPFFTRAADVLLAAQIALTARQSQGDVSDFADRIGPLITRLGSAVVTGVATGTLAEMLSEVRTNWTLLHLTESMPREAVPAAVALVDDLFRLSAAILGPMRNNRAFLWDCTRRFLGAPRSVVRSASVPVARAVGKRAFVDTLVVEILEPGTGEAFHHPDDVFHTNPHDTFAISMQHAFTAACQLANRTGMDGRWRLLQRPHFHPVEVAQGKSASGAAARGWWYTLVNKVPDAEIIVLAEMDGQGRLRGVSGVPAKTRRIAADGRMDTLVVATAQGKKEAAAALPKSGQVPVVSVVQLDTATLECLIQVRSVQAQEAMHYLSELARVLDDTPWMHGGERIRASEIAVEPLVLTQEKRIRTPRRGDGKATHNGGMERHFPMDEIEAQRYELPLRDEKRREERWWPAVRRGHRKLGLQGAPGSGKTFITRHTVASLALQSAAKIGVQEARLEDVTIPLWVTAKALAQSSAGEMSDTLLEALGESSPVRLQPSWSAWLRRALGGPHAFIVVDALDELLDSERVGFQKQAKPLEDLRGRVLVTCRTMLWPERKGWLGWRRIIEMELAPFTSRQQREGIRKFFGTGNPALGQSMERLLQGNFALRHTCTSPLLLALGCLLHEEGLVHRGTTRALLYGHMMRKLIAGAWHGVQRPLWLMQGAQEDRCLRLLADIAWGLFAAAPHVNRFTLGAWEQAAQTQARRGQAFIVSGELLEHLEQVGFVVPAAAWEQAAEARGRRGQAHVEPGELLEHLEQVGFVVPAGFDEQRGERCWSFVHRTFLEFLAARALSHMEQGVWLQETKQHLWFQPEWLEVLTFLAGLVDDAIPLLDAVEKEQKNDDLFGSMLYLKARLLGAATRVEEGAVWRVCAEIMTFWRETLDDWRDCLHQFALPMLATLAGNAAARGILAEDMLEEEGWRRVGASEALGALGATEAVAALLARTQDENAYVQMAAARALGTLGATEAAAALLALTQDEERMVREAAAEALGALGATEAVPALLALTQDEDRLACAAAARVLGTLGATEAVATLLVLTQDEHRWVRQVSARALGALGATEAVPALLTLAQGEDRSMHAAAAEALGALGATEAVPALLALTQDEDEFIRQVAAEALGALGTTEAVPALLALMQDEHRRVREAAAQVLGNIGAEGVIERLLELIQDNESEVRRVAALGLWQIAWKHRKPIRVGRNNQRV